MQCQLADDGWSPMVRWGDNTGPEIFSWEFCCTCTWYFYFYFGMYYHHDGIVSAIHIFARDFHYFYSYN